MTGSLAAGFAAAGAGVPGADPGGLIAVDGPGATAGGRAAEDGAKDCPGGGLPRGRFRGDAAGSVEAGPAIGLGG